MSMAQIDTLQKSLMIVKKHYINRASPWIKQKMNMKVGLA